ncbi:hypothetical protein B0A55_10909 [Friedmanniomyces simplex]|uniref:ATPase synthesis protein 25 n=1 Tax=Friedmanniomyces simplex TaxID=329884 RepID=A0A4U0WJ00_9PEZI|nr:hypothetical protein B0A55_10909 [Friedmanniomyces simplex]
MALPSTILKPLSCQSCRQWALRSFISSIGGSPLHQPRPVQKRAISRTIHRPNESRERIQQDTHALTHINDTGNAGQSALDKLISTSQAPSQPPHHDEQPATKPWYLQPAHQTPQHQEQEKESPMAARQRMPDLPPHPPPLLEPLLRNISIEQGMDDLSLLDLRLIDPPPALGANLIMIMGTARSEKHLHVSADRLCRWLRTEYKMTPYADGLLGRNELKLKLRRRAKRMRLMSGGVGAGTADTDLEEGIRTGWVCVNIGRVGGGELPEQQLERERRQKEIVGFGKQEGGCSIVVQLMTEEKRGEIDLERLWTGMLRGAQRESEEVKSQEQALEAEGEGGRESVVVHELDPAGMVHSAGATQRGVAVAA